MTNIETLPQYSIDIESEHMNMDMDDPSLFITITWNVGGLEIKWSWFDMEFEEFFQFASDLKSNQQCSLSGGGNSYWSLDHANNAEHCEMEFNISGSGGDSALKMNLPNIMIVESIDLVCVEIIKFQNKYPDSTRF